MSQPDETTRRLLAALDQAADRIEALEQARREPIAIVGVSCRFPGGADDPASFWRLLRGGADAVTEVPADRWSLDTYYDADPAAAGKMYSRHGAFIRDVDLFDPQSFEIAPREAVSLDPQQRLLLELTWHAFDDAGITRERVAGTAAGVFVGVTNHDYERLLARAGGDARIDVYFSTGNTLNATAGRIAYVFGLQGPALAVDTACSSSLVAVHLAVQALRRGECPLAVAAGVNLILSPEGHIALSRGRALAPDGRCKTFDAAADGYVRGEGGGAVILKRLSDAVTAGDRIYAVIRGSAINQDGASGGFTVPNGRAQQALLRSALADARLEPADIGYVEAHGTGTALGDPIEARALGLVFAEGRSAEAPLLVGALKTNIGHLESAAGIASVIKTALAVYHGEIPPQLHFHTPSPHIDWHDLPLRVVTSPTEFPAGQRRAGVSAFGASGTNAHVILEQAPDIVVRVAPLPARQFNRRRYWIEPPRAVSLLGTRMDLAGSGETRFESQLRIDGHEFLQDHRVHGRLVLPAAVYVDIALEAAAAVTGADAVTLEDVVFERPLMLPAAGTVSMQVAVSGDLQFRIYARQDGEWTQHATGRIAAHDSRAAAVPGAAPRDAEIAGAEYYAECARRGIGFGPAFQGLESLWRIGESGAESRISLPAGLTAGEFAIHPVLLDGAFQTIGPAAAARDADAAFLPFAIRRLRLHRRPALRLSARAELGLSRAESRGPGAAELSASLVLWDERGVVADIEGFTLRRAAALSSSADPLYTVEWRERARVVVDPRGDTPPPRVLVIDEPDATAGLEETLRRGCEVVIDEIRRAAAEASPPRLFVVTRGAQAIEGIVPPAARAHAAVWGALRTAAMEHPELRLVRIDLDPAASPEASAAFIREEIAAGGPDDEVAVRGGRRLVPRLARIGAVDAGIPLRADRTYAVTGGLSGLGLLTAGWLVSRGARHLALLARSQPGEQATRLIQEWRDAGITVLALACDVSDAAALAAALATARGEAPLGGIVHSAGVLADAALVNQTWDHVRRVAAPKLFGAWHLHELTLDDPLDFFVMYASTAGVLGSPGQSNHAAASACLDALAWHRLAHGRPALSIDWGAWSGVGVAARAGVLERARARGVGHIDPQTGLRILDRLVGSDFTQVAVAPVEWTTFAAQFPAGRAPGLLTELVHLRAAGGHSKRTVDVRRQLAAAPAAEQPGVIEQYVLQRLAQVLDAPPDQIDCTQPLSMLGLDSLMALDMRGHFKADLDLDVPVTLLLTGTSAQGIAAHLHETLARGAAAPAAAPSPAAAAARPLAHGQKALWFLHRAAPDSPAYNTAIAIRIRSVVDASALQRAFGVLVARHDALRTTIGGVDGSPVQQIWSSRDIVLERHAATGSDDETLRQQVTAAYARPFDLERGPLARIDLFTRAADDHVLLLTMHHVVGDAWSLWILIDEWLRVYRADVSGVPAQLPSVTPYGHFGEWQATLLAGDAGAAAWAHWKAALEGPLPTLDLPGDRPRPPVMSFRGGSLDFAIPGELTARLRETARQRGVTLYVLLLTCIQVLLRRLSSQDDVVIGTLASGRTDPMFADTVGYFVNPVVIRTQLQGALRFDEVLTQVRDQALRAMEHQDFPFPLLVERLQPARDPSRSPIFQVLFVMQKAPSSHAPAAIERAEAALRLEPFAFPQMEGQFDLTIEITDAEPLRGVLRYSTDLFERETTGRFAAQLLELLEAACRDTQAPIDALTPLPAAEAQQLDRWNATGAPFPDACIHHLIEAQVGRTPDAVAVEFEDEHWSYRELNERADALASELRSLGAGPETLVGICMERSLGLVASILAVLKAGAAYVPLDPDYPRERLEFMLQDADVAILLAGGDPPRAVRALTRSRRATDAGPGNLAYVIYTSGSTGRPKGAMNTHRGLCNRLTWMQDAYRLDASDAVLQKTPFSFDVSVWEFLWPLMTGARLVVCRPGGHQDPAYLARIIRERKVTTLHFVPSMLRAFVEQPAGGPFPSLRRVICSGEALPPDLADKALERLGAELHNLYGPTEASIDVTAWPCRPGDGEVPIGAPIANTQIHIVDRQWQPCPIGVAGELFIAGVNVGRGYHARPDLTADRFVPDPFGAPGERMYRTGDLAKWRGDGQVVYLGRLDTQVKIRGFRIELGEIESRLAQHAHVREAAVIAQAGADGDARLIAYAVAEGDEPSTTELHRFLRETLPHYMVPAAFVWLPALPLSPNGKLDRRALPAPPTVRPRLDSEFAAPSGDHERAIAAVWSAVLGLDRIGVHDNFFELGGQSLLLAQVHARVQAELAPSLTLIEMFQHPTVHLLARHISGATGDDVTPSNRAEARTDRAGEVADRRRSRLEHRRGVTQVPQA